MRERTILIPQVLERPQEAAPDDERRHDRLGGTGGLDLGFPGGRAWRTVDIARHLVDRQQRAEDRVLDHRRQLGGNIASAPECALDPLLVVLPHRREALDGVGR